MARAPLSIDIVATGDIADESFDSVVIVANGFATLTGPLASVKEVLNEYAKVDASAETSVFVTSSDAIPSRRIVYSATGPLNRDQDDVRSYADAAVAGIKRALAAGSKRPLLVRPEIQDGFPAADLVAVLGALHALYVPLEIREAVPSKKVKADVLGYYNQDTAFASRIVETAKAIESGRLVCRDIGGSDPERMAAPKVAEYVQQVFRDTCIKVDIESDINILEREYPLLAAVNRAARLVERHQARVIFLEYVGEGEITDTVLVVGKGITYDTGGADVKAGGHMAGMHRDKCGAAAVAGFFQTLATLKPKGLKVVGAMTMVRNSIGSEGYVADEIITSRAGARIRVGNTDAEGRMVLSDLLCVMKEKALHEVNPQLFTIATLTGHAVLAVGEEYSIVLGNGPAVKKGLPDQLQAAGHTIGDPFEVTTIRREDYQFASGKSEYEDLLQCNNKPSSQTPRGHQFPAAFMIGASGLNKYGIDSEKPLPYCHIDIAGSSGPFPGIPTGAPISALINYYILNRQ